jgi:PAS domain S-box-containing protein
MTPESAVRVRAETVLRLIRTVRAAILIANSRGRYVDVNRAATRLTGYSRSELVGMAVWDLTPTPRLTLSRRLWRDFLTRGRMSGQYQIRHKTGRMVTAQYFAAANVLPGVHVSALVAVASPSRAPRRRRAARA